MNNRTIKTCSVIDCNSYVASRGWCAKHYTRWLRHGDPLGGGPERATAPHVTCSVEDCPDPATARGWCGKHYQRWSVHGDPETILRRELGPFGSHEDAYNALTEWRGSCLIWVGPKLPNGYGKMSAKGVRKYAHRYAWERVNGTIPEGLVVNHTCWNTRCVNVEHLEAVTVSENNSYMSGAQINNKTSKVRNVEKKRDKWQVRVQKNGKRYNFGVYDTIEEAAAVAEQARKEVFGDFAGRG